MPNPSWSLLRGDTAIVAALLVGKCGPDFAPCAGGSGWTGIFNIVRGRITHLVISKASPLELTSGVALPEGLRGVSACGEPAEPCAMIGAC